MGFGVDTVSGLNTINWSLLATWFRSSPCFAGRYFFGDYAWQAGEAKGCAAVANGTLRYVAPIVGAYLSHETLSGQAGYNQGAVDANATLANLQQALDTGELTLPATGNNVIVYLDVEAGTPLTVEYWAGWAKTVCSYKIPAGKSPFVPGIYCQFVPDSAGRYVPCDAVRNVLDHVYTTYPDAGVVCYGFWSNEPEFEKDAGPAANPDWAVFGSYAQPCGATGPYAVPILLWQYCEDVVGREYQGSAWASGQNVDFNCSQADAEAYMLVIKG